MKKLTMIATSVAAAVYVNHAAAGSKFELLTSMFNDMTVNKDINALPKYYTRDFKLFTNGMTMNYQQFYASHKKIYQTNITYRMQYDKQTVVEQGDKVAARVFIITKKPKQPATKIEVMLIAHYRDNKIDKLWELTYPNWSKLKALKSIVDMQ